MGMQSVLGRVKHVLRIKPAQQSESTSQLSEPLKKFLQSEKVAQDQNLKPKYMNMTMNELYLRAMDGDCIAAGLWNQRMRLDKDTK